MTDLRDKVKGDRGLIKYIELAIPGFHGYRKKEDLRIADSLLRTQLADKIKTDVSVPLEGAREAASRELNLDIMNDIGDLIKKVNLAETKIRHAEHGYSGISPHFRIGERELDTLYEYDLSMIDLVNNLSEGSQGILADAEAGDFSSMKSSCSQAKKDVVEFLNVFNQRHNTMADLGAF